MELASNSVLLVNWTHLHVCFRLQSLKINYSCRSLEAYYDVFQPPSSVARSYQGVRDQNHLWL